MNAETEGRMAAVAAILRDGPDGEDAEILLIRRAERLRDPWSGHMAFPGGRREVVDRTIVDTAIRETREEVGLDLAAHGTVLHRLPNRAATARGKITDLTVAAFVFELPRAETNLTNLVSNVEVAEAIWTPLGPLARGETVTTFEYLHEDTMLTFPGYRVGERVVWGLTWRMLQALFTALHE
ncbi:CoA pyrophosphatase [Pendulispora rubella]|uniref:CoA pyrophosphatase n=1 Tax=Pendulispora rubella TaxID=2741070 RepID=A0ABZ2L3B4_9BACT